MPHYRAGTTFIVRSGVLFRESKKLKAKMLN